MFEQVHVYRAGPRAASATGTAGLSDPFGHVREFMQYSLAPAGALHRTRVMSRRMQREKREAARIPAAHPPAGRPARILLNVETGAGRTDERAGPAAETTLGLPFPNRAVERLIQFLAELLRIETLFDAGQILFQLSPLFKRSAINAAEHFVRRDYLHIFQYKIFPFSFLHIQGFLDNLPLYFFRIRRIIFNPIVYV